MVHRARGALHQVGSVKSAVKTALHGLPVLSFQRHFLSKAYQRHAGAIILDRFLETSQALCAHTHGQKPQPFGPRTISSSLKVTDTVNHCYIYRNQVSKLPGWHPAQSSARFALTTAKCSFRLLASGQQ